MMQHLKRRALGAGSLFLLIFGLCGVASAMAGNAKIGIITNNAAIEDFDLQIINPPEGMDFGPAPDIAKYKNIGNGILDVAGGEVDGSDGAEIIVLAENTSGANSLTIFDLPAEGTADLDLPIASDTYIGKNNEHITVGDFDADPEMEVAVIKKKRSGAYKLLVYNLPTVPGGNTGRAVAYDLNIGTGITALSSGNFDNDDEHELVIVRMVNGSSELQIYNPPRKRRGSIGEPILSYVDIKSDIIANGLAVGNFSTYTAHAEIALVFLEQDNAHSLEIFDPPQMVGDRLTPAMAGYSNIGGDIIGITSFHLAAEGNPPVNEPPKAVIRADAIRGEAPLTVFFDGRESFDKDGFIESYQWDLENKDLGRDDILEYTFDNPGVYEVTLTVTDNEGAWNSARISIEVTDPVNDIPDGELRPEEEELLLLINAIRQDNGLSPLNDVKALGIAARRHSEDMAQNNFISHTGSDGSSPWERMADAGYQFYTAGENVAAGQPTPNSVATAWMNSSGHRANILNPNFCEIGAGYAYGENSYFRHYWTLDFGCSR